MTRWYTADTHFGDPGILMFFDRPFRSPAAMDASEPVWPTGPDHRARNGSMKAEEGPEGRAMVERISSRVKPDDDLWIVGDFALADSVEARGWAATMFGRLPGRKHLVRGNHDPDPILALGWESIHEIAEVQDGETRVVLCHYPLVTWNGARDGALHLFGHVHTNWEGFQGAVNVGVDWWDFAPVRIDQAERRALSLPENPTHWQAERLLR